MVERWMPPLDDDEDSEKRKREGAAWVRRERDRQAKEFSTRLRATWRIGIVLALMFAVVGAALTALVLNYAEDRYQALVAERTIDDYFARAMAMGSGEPAPPSVIPPRPEFLEDPGPVFVQVITAAAIIGLLAPVYLHPNYR
jgi:hypothetical protein